MGIAITKTSKETRQKGRALTTAPPWPSCTLHPSFPYFRRSGHMRPQLYAYAYNSAVLALSLSVCWHHYGINFVEN